MSPSPEIRFSPIIAALARLPDLRALPMAALHIVMGMRLCAMCDRAERNPLAELATRFTNVAAAEQVMLLIGLIGKSWPEPFMVGRPCCTAMTPDEHTLANLARCAMAADRDGFARQIDGFVRPGRHDALFAQAVRCVAELAVIQKRA